MATQRVLRPRAKALVTQSTIIITFNKSISHETGLLADPVARNWRLNCPVASDDVEHSSTNDGLIILIQRCAIGGIPGVTEETDTAILLVASILGRSL